MTHRFSRAAAWAGTALALSITAPVLLAQDAPKSFVSESNPAFPVFQQWVTTFVGATPDTPPPGDLQLTRLAAPGGAPAASFEAMPVILGEPELPLLGGNASDAARNWGQNLNFQGLHSRLIVLAADGRRREVRSMAAPLRAGERFKIRLTTTFDAVADIAQVLGAPYGASRTGQIYPTPGQSVGIPAGQAVELPLAPNQYFVMGGSTQERVLLSVRHARAVAGSGSTQPAYRQDGPTGSSYLQLVPRGRWPVIEQLMAVAP